MSVDCIQSNKFAFDNREGPVYFMVWSHGVEYWSGFLEWNLGRKLWNGTENLISVIKFVLVQTTAITKRVANA